MDDEDQEGNDDELLDAANGNADWRARFEDRFDSHLVSILMRILMSMLQSRRTMSLTLTQLAKSLK